jgi:putative endonuclease
MFEDENCVYIMTNNTRTVLYTGVTNNLTFRVSQHKAGTGSKFVAKYKATRLAYFECGGSIAEAIAREKQIKAGNRAGKIRLIESINPNWDDLSKEIL